MPRNRHLINGSSTAMESMKYEIAEEFGIQLGAETPARLNGSVGGEMVKRLVAFAEQSIRNL